MPENFCRTEVCRLHIYRIALVRMFSTFKNYFFQVLPKLIQTKNFPEMTESKVM